MILSLGQYVNSMEGKANRIAMSAVVGPNVSLGLDVRIDDWAVVGYSPIQGQINQCIIGDYSVIRTHAVIYAGTTIGTYGHIGHHAVVREFTKIGDNVSIGTGSIVEHRVKIANGVRIHSHAFVPEFTVLLENCWLGPNVVLTNARFPRGAQVKETLVGPRIGPHAMIGANATILPGIQIGAGALVGAGSVVTRDVEPLSVVQGVPAKTIGKISDLKLESGEPAYTELLDLLKFSPETGEASEL